MKKLIAGLLLILLIFIALAYLLIPSQMEIETSSIVKVRPPAAMRILGKVKQWQRWWPYPGKENQSDSFRQFNNSFFKIDQQLENAFNIQIVLSADSIHTLLTLIPISNDSLQIQWNGVLSTS